MLDGGMLLDSSYAALNFNRNVILDLSSIVIRWESVRGTQTKTIAKSIAMAFKSFFLFSSPTPKIYVESLENRRTENYSRNFRDQGQKSKT